MPIPRSGGCRPTVTAVEQMPFWITFELSKGTVLYALGLAVLAAVIAGVLPGLKTTGVGLEVNLRALGGGTGLRLGPMWTSLIVAQVAVAVAILPVALYVVSEVVRVGDHQRRIPGRAVRDCQSRSPSQASIMRRVEAEPGVAGVAFSSNIPGYAGDRFIEFRDEATRQRLGSEEVVTMSVDLRMFDLYDAAILAGRPFSSADLGTASAIVNRAFAREFFESATPLGQRFSFVRRAVVAGRHRARVVRDRRRRR